MNSRGSYKMFEQKICGPIDEILEKIQKKQLPLKGEFVMGIRKKVNK